MGGSRSIKPNQTKSARVCQVCTATHGARAGDGFGVGSNRIRLNQTNSAKGRNDFVVTCAKVNAVVRNWGRSYGIKVNQTKLASESPGSAAISERWVGGCFGRSPTESD